MMGLTRSGKNISDKTYLVEVMKNGQLKNFFKHVSQTKKIKKRIT